MKRSTPLAAWAIAIGLAVIVLVFLIRVVIGLEVTGGGAIAVAGVVASVAIFACTHMAVAWLVLRPHRWSPVLATLLGAWAVFDLVAGVSADSVLMAVVGLLIIVLSWTRTMRAFVKGPT